MKEIKINTDKTHLLKHMGSIYQLGGIRQYEFTEGRAKGTRAVMVTTGSGFDFTVLPDRCLDIAEARYKGIPIAYMSKAEISAPTYLEHDGMEWLRSFYAGLVTTCGFSNVGAPCEDQRRIFGMQKHGLHGRLSNIPANEVCCSGEWIDNIYTMSIKGKIRQSAVHGENLILRRTINAWLGEKKLEIHDEIENEGHTEEPLMLLYHINFGYPLLSEKSRLVLASKGIKPADNIAAAEIDSYDRFHEPRHLQDERCYFHDLNMDSDGQTHVLLINDEMELGVELSFDRKELPCFTEWKMLAEGEYVLGLEPGNVNPIGRLAAKQQGLLEYIKPGDVKKTNIKIEILDGKEDIERALNEVAKLRL